MQMNIVENQHYTYSHEYSTFFIESHERSAESLAHFKRWTDSPMKLMHV